MYLCVLNNSSKMHTTTTTTTGVSPWGIIVKVLDHVLKISELELQSCYYIHFWTNTFRKVMNFLFPRFLVKQYHCCSSTWMSLALNNAQRLICHLIKKPNQNTNYYYYCFFYNYNNAVCISLHVNVLQEGINPYVLLHLLLLNSWADWVL